VITEVLAMLVQRDQQSFLVWLNRGVKAELLEIRCTNPAYIEKAIKLTADYSDLPMDFADVSVYLLAIETGIHEVASVDHRDFAVYRLPGRRRFKNVLMDE
jgi:predicted nucleic acid-binding protein